MKWYGQEAYPDADEWHMPDDEQYVADDKTDNEAPEDIGMLGDELRTRRNAFHCKGGEHDGHDGIGRNAQSEGRHEADLTGCIGSGFRRDDTFNGALAEPLRLTGDLAFQRIAHDRCEDRARARQEA